MFCVPPPKQCVSKDGSVVMQHSQHTVGQGGGAAEKGRLGGVGDSAALIIRNRKRNHLRNINKLRLSCTKLRLRLIFSVILRRKLIKMHQLF